MAPSESAERVARHRRRDYINTTIRRLYELLTDLPEGFVLTKDDKELLKYIKKYGMEKIENS